MSIATVTGVTKSVMKNFAKEAKRNGFTKEGTGITKKLESGVELSSKKGENGEMLLIASKKTNEELAKDIFVSKNGKVKPSWGWSCNDCGEVQLYPGKKGFLGIGRRNGRFRVLTSDDKHVLNFNATLNAAMTKIKEIILCIAKRDASTGKNEVTKRVSVSEKELRDVLEIMEENTDKKRSFVQKIVDAYV